MSDIKVTKAQIDAIMQGVTFHVHHIPGTTTTIATAFDTDGFSLAVGLSACVDPANFDPALGEQYACEDAEKKAIAKLWELEGYRLAKSTPCHVSSNLSFGLAVEALKVGKRVARAGWNGKGMWLSYVDPYSNIQFTLIEKNGAEGTYSPYIGMKTADNKYVPWLASQTDVLADDWSIVD